MTREHQQAMARYEEARIRYRQAVRASLRGAGPTSGHGIRDAIRALEQARAELARHQPAPPPPPAPPAPESLPRRLFRRLLQAS
jgi:hypothetical protein